MIALGDIIHKHLIDRDFLEDVHAQNLEYPAQTFVDSMNLIDDRQPWDILKLQILGAHGILCGAKESFDSEALLNSFKEEFDLPTTPANGCDRQGWQLEVIPL